MRYIYLVCHDFILRTTHFTRAKGYEGCLEFVQETAPTDSLNYDNDSMFPRFSMLAHSSTQNSSGL
jgi:hypothetical protein